MTAIALSDATRRAVTRRGSLRALCAFELHIAARSRRLWGGVAAMGLGAAMVTAFGLSAFRQLGVGATSPAAVGLLDLMLLVPSAFAIVAGATALQRDRDSGFLDMLRAAGASGADIAISKLTATLFRSWAIVAGGFGAAAVVLAGSVGAADLLVYVALIVVTLLTTAACAAIGLFVASPRSHSRGGHAAIVGLAVWFALAIGLDLALFAIAPFMRVSAPALFAILTLDPIEAGRVLGLLALGADATVLGPLGTLLRDGLGVGRAAGLIVLCDTLWVGLATLGAGAIATRRD